MSNGKLDKPKADDMHKPTGAPPQRVQSPLARRIFQLRQMGYSEHDVSSKLRIPIGIIRREIADL